MAKKETDSVKTVQTKRALVAAMTKSLGIVTQAFTALGISRDTYYSYYNNDKAFKK